MLSASNTSLKKFIFNSNNINLYKTFIRSCSFHLDPTFVDGFKHKKPNFGFGGLGELVFRRTYSRVKHNGKQEEFFETVQRVIEGTWNILKNHCLYNNEKPWDEDKAQIEAQSMYERMFAMKFLPAGRGLWAMGTPIINEQKLHAALNSCAFISTSEIELDPSHPFCFLMDMSMIGIGVGFDTKGADKNILIPGYDKNSPKNQYIIENSRDGWVDALRKLIQSHYYGLPQMEYDYSSISPENTLISKYGDISLGPDALKNLLEKINNILENHNGKSITVTGIVDIMNLIGVSVVAAHERRTAELALGDAYNEEYLNLKNYELNPNRNSFGWTSNNSVYGEIGMDYHEICERIRINGEPGVIWLENMKKYGRMKDVPDYKDNNASGGPPCLEQTLESHELCCLVETFPNNHENLNDFIKTLKYAFLYAKIVTLCDIHWEQSVKVMQKNRRIGCSITGIQQFVSRQGIDTLKEWCEVGYQTIKEEDYKLSKWFNIPKSIKTTCVKPSGTVSLLAGATPGMHWPESRYYIRRVRIRSKSPLLFPLQNAGFHTEPDVNNPNTMVVSFPVDCGENIRSLHEVSIWEQLASAAFLQEHWADNQVSSTITFDPETESQELEKALDFYQYKLKSISFLPRINSGAFPQMPYEAISENHYNKLKSNISQVHFCDITRDNADFVEDKFCDGETCTIKPKFE